MILKYENAAAMPIQPTIAEMSSRGTYVSRQFLSSLFLALLEKAATVKGLTHVALK